LVSGVQGACIPVSDEASQRLRAFIIDRRHSLGFSQTRAAEVGGFSRATLASFEAGKSAMPTRETLVCIAAGLRLPYSALESVINGEQHDSANSPEVQHLAERLTRLSPQDFLTIEALVSRLEQTGK